MANSYEWIIRGVECYPDYEGYQNVVFLVHWRRNVTDGQFVADAYGSLNIDFDPLAVFVPFSELSKDQVNGWLVEHLGNDKVLEIDADLDKQISELAAPSVVRPPLPW